MTYVFDEAYHGTVSEAVFAFPEAGDIEHAIRGAMLLAGDLNAGGT